MCCCRPGTCGVSGDARRAHLKLPGGSARKPSRATFYTRNSHFKKKTKSGPDGLVGGLARGAARSPVDYKPSHRTLACGEVAVPMTQGHRTRCPGQTEKRELSPPTKASTHASLPAPGSDRCSSTDYCAGLVPPLSRVKTQATHSTQSNGPPS